MKSRGSFGAKVEAELIRSAEMKEQRALISSIWDVEHWRQGEDGLYLLSKTQDTNVVTNQGLDKLLNVMFGAAGGGEETQITTWYVTLVESNTTPAAGLTYATPTYTESTAYTEGTRPAYVETASSGQSINNSASKATFTINASKTIYGSSLVGGGTAPTTKGDTAGGGYLYCYSLFGSSKSVVSSDVLNITITLTAADA